MKIRSQEGSAATVMVIVLLVLALGGALAFGYKSYNDSNHYKNDVDKIVAEEVVKAEKAQEEKLKKEFEEQSKSPNTTYQSSPTYGSVTFNYPKTWSAYVEETTSQPIDAYYHPKQVPTVATGTVYALRVELVSSPYATVMQSFNTSIKTGKLKAAAYIPEKLKSAGTAQPGTRLDGEIASKATGSMVVLPVRDKTLKIYTLSNDFASDFNNIVLPSLTFTP